MGQIILKLYYKILNFSLHKRYIYDSVDDKYKKIFLYFDYEREFSGLNTFVEEERIDEILAIISPLKATWFTVGKLIEKYPESVYKVHAAGHEIASHSFSHSPPYSMNKNELIEDFMQFKSTTTIDVKGFHAPQGLWTLRLITLLTQFGYLYDVMTPHTKSSFIKRPFRYKYSKFNGIVRFISVMDDWEFYGSKMSEEEIFQKWIKCFKQIGMSDLVGIGFHPWVLISDDNIFNAFKRFIAFLKEQETLMIKPVIDYYHTYK